MTSTARKSCLLLTLAVLAFGFNSLSAEVAPMPGYSARGAGTTMTNACNAAIALVEDHCDLHGAITTYPGRCTDVYDPWTGAYMTTICDCTAKTGLCLIARPFPGIPR